MERSYPGWHLAVIVPELVEHQWYQVLLHNHTAAIIKGYLYFSDLERVTVVNVPWYVHPRVRVPVLSRRSYQGCHRSGSLSGTANILTTTAGSNPAFYQMMKSRGTISP